MSVGVCQYKEECEKACDCERDCTEEDEKTCDLEIAFYKPIENAKIVVDYGLLFW